MTTSTNTNPLPTPWYKQFWPWFVFGLPAVTVVAGIITVFIAFNNADSLVKDNYYRDGLAINQQLAQDVTASRLKLNAEVIFDAVSGEIIVDLAGDIAPPATLNLLLIHPGDEKRDASIELAHIANFRYRADLERTPDQRYYLRLHSNSVKNQEWRLNGEINFSKQASTKLIHE